MQVQDHSEIQPALAVPNVTGVTFPFLVRILSYKIAIQQVWRNVELVIAAPPSVDCCAIACRAMVSRAEADHCLERGSNPLATRHQCLDAL